MTANYPAPKTKRDWDSSASFMLHDASYIMEDVRFSHKTCAGEGHPLTHVAGGIAWCKGTSGAVWHLSHRGDGSFYWEQIGFCGGEDMADIAEMIDLWRYRLERGTVRLASHNLPHPTYDDEEDE